jgi:hypothetical protein
MRLLFNFDLQQKQRIDCVAFSTLINKLLIQIKAKERGKLGQECCDHNCDFVTFLLRHTPLSTERKL